MGNSNSRDSNDNAKKVAMGVGIAVGGAILGTVTFGIGYAAAAAATAKVAEIATDVAQESSSSSNLHAISGGSGTTTSKASSPVWQSFEPYRGEIRRNNLSGSSRCYFTWDYTHNHIEKYNHLGKPIDAINPITGNRLFKDVSGHRPLKL